MLKVLGRFAGGTALVAGTLGAGAGLALLTATPAAATNPDLLTVNDAGDSPQTPSNCLTSTVTTGPDCTLRAALAQATADGVDAVITLPDPTTVKFNSTTHYTVSGSQLDMNDVNQRVTIEGSAGQTVTRIDGSTSRVLKVEMNAVAIVTGVTVENGEGNNGGGILDCGDLTLNNSTVQDNTASSSGGGIEISAEGSAILNDDAVDGNTVTGADNNGGGGISVLNSSSTATSNLTLNATDVSENTADALTDDEADGGGISIFGTEEGVDPNLTVDIENGSTIDENIVGSNEDGVGAGISDGDGVLTVTDSTIDENGPDGETDVYGGGVDVFTAFSDGQAATFTNDTIHDNSAYDGGGIEFDDGNTTTTNTTIDGNVADESGAGIYDDTEDASVTTIDSSTISNNSMPEPSGGSPFYGDGGGFTSDGCNAVVFTNDTITGNSSLNYGGGYYAGGCSFSGGPNQPAAVTPHMKSQAQQSNVVIDNPTTFLFDTITDNTSIDGNAGNIAQEDASTITLGDSIVAGGISDSDPENCEINNVAPGSFTSNGYNLIDDTTCGTAGTGDIINQPAHLGALGANGGPTNTELPASNSPAIGGVPGSVCSGTGVTTDQRGVARPSGANGTCTIGAVEVVAAAPPAVNLNGYRLVANEGGIFDFGLNFHGSLANNHLNAPIVGIANSPGYDGYLMAGGDGGVFALGGANFYGSLGGQTIPSPISAIAAPPSENGYWLAAQNGKIYNFGAAPALPALSLPSGAHIVGMASTQDGGGAWLTDQLGDVYAEGDALYVGGLGGVHINKPIVGIAAAASGQGYVLAASDGGAFNYGTQGFYGSVPGSLAPGQSLVAPIVGIAVTHSGKGYWFVGADGGVFNYGDAPFLGSIYTAIGNHPLNGPVVGIQHLGELPSA